MPSISLSLSETGMVQNCSANIWPVNKVININGPKLIHTALLNIRVLSDYFFCVLRSYCDI